MTENPEKFKEVIKHIAKSEQLIGQGNEKRVYTHPHDKERVVGISRQSLENRPDHAKAKFYLTKILHLLFPKNIPNAYQVTTEPKTTTRQYVETSRLHKEAQNLETTSGREARTELRERMERNPRAQEFIKALRALEIMIDLGSINFSIDEDDNLVFLDDITYWTPDTIKKLHVVIDKKLQGLEKERALKFLKRIKELDEYNQ